MGVPLNHPFQWDFPLQNHPFWRYLQLWKTPYQSGKDMDLPQSAVHKLHDPRLLEGFDGISPGL